MAALLAASAIFCFTSSGMEKGFSMASSLMRVGVSSMWYAASLRTSGLTSLEISLVFGDFFCITGELYRKSICCTREKSKISRKNVKFGMQAHIPGCFAGLHQLRIDSAVHPPIVIISNNLLTDNRTYDSM